MRMRLSRPAARTRATLTTLRWPLMPRKASVKAAWVVGRSVVQVKSSARMTLPAERATMSPTSTAWGVRTGATTGSVSPRRSCKAGMVSAPPFDGCQKLFGAQGLVGGARGPGGRLLRQGRRLERRRGLGQAGSERDQLRGHRLDLPAQLADLGLGVAALARHPVSDSRGLVGLIA